MDRALGAFAYPPSARLLRPRDFDAVLGKGRRSKSKHFDLKWCAGAGQIARLGCIVPKRHSPLAVHRNRIKRLARDAFRRRRLGLRQMDLVFRQITRVADPFDPAIFQEIEALFEQVVNA